jgi:hypothetical protein
MTLIEWEQFQDKRMNLTVYEKNSCDLLAQSRKDIY